MRFTLSILIVIALIGCEGSTEQPRNTTLENLRGQWVLVNYWAQWCKPCIEEIPELNDFGNNREDVTVLGVNFEGASGEALATQVAALGIEFAIIDDPSTALGIPMPVVLPTTLLIDPTGTMVQSLLGPQTKTSLDAAILAAQDKSAR